MGNCTSKSEITVTPVKTNIELKLKETDEIAIDPNVLLDPRSPDIHRTPLTDVLGNRLNYREKLEQLPSTPIRSLRSKLLNYSINDMKLLDPRSPSQFIPRTPLNLSFDDNSRAAALCSIEYNGNIEDESCRNFNERLANITFDDADNDNRNESKLPKNTLHEIKEEDTKSLKLDGTDKLQDSFTSDFHTPVTTVPAVSKLQFNQNMDAEEKIISPIVSSTVLTNKLNSETSAFSSTPIVASNSQLKNLLLKSHIKKLNKPEIFEDDETNEDASLLMNTGNKSEDEILCTPKRSNKVTADNLPRTPLGVLNRRSKSVESLSQRRSQMNIAKENDQTTQSRNKLNDENVFFTPQAKSKAFGHNYNSTFRSRVSIFDE